MADLKYYGNNILNHGLEVRRGNISGSATSTGSFGLIEADIQTTLGGLSDTTLSTPSDGQVLAYTGSISQWVNKGLSSAGIGLGQKHHHSQDTAATTWTITHNMGFQYPNVNVYDSNDKIIIPSEITATSDSVLTITFGFIFDFSSFSSSVFTFSFIFCVFFSSTIIY